MSFLRFLFQNRLFLAAGFLISFFSSFGQTFFISVFAGQIMADFRLSHGQWGLIYTGATTISAVVMIWAGALTDRFRIRALAVWVLLSLAAACVMMATVQAVWALLLVVVGLRFMGQGMMSHLSIVAMARWFVASRGQAISVAAMGFAVGQAILPVSFVMLFDWFGWRQLWLLGAGLVLLSIPVIHHLLKAERTPQSVSRDNSAAGMSGQHWTRRMVLHHWLFWALVPLLLGPPAWGTSLFFHQVHMTEVKGWALIEFTALMPLFTVVSIGSTFATGALIDKFGTARLMQFYMVPFAAGFLVMSLSATLWGATIAMVLFGIGMGTQATVPAAFWAEFYGTRHIGAVKAMAAAVMVFGTAIGPGITSALIDAGIDFPAQMLTISGYFALTTALTALAINRARPGLTQPA